MRQQITPFQRIMSKLKDVNRELWLILTLFVVSLILNYLVASHRMVLGFYYLPTLLSAYYFGRRHAVLTAFASIFIVYLIIRFNPDVFTNLQEMREHGGIFDMVVWAGILVMTAYAMGTLHERSRHQLDELRETYHGVLLILQQFIAKDKYTQNHSYRVSIYAARIGGQLGLSQDRIEDVRAAALLHDIGKLDISRELLYKAAQLTKDEYEEIQEHVSKGVDILQPVGGSLRRVIPIVLAHHDRYDGTGYHPTKGDEIPIEARIIAVADAFDAITADRPYRKGSTAFEAKEIIQNRAGEAFDPRVVDAFVRAFNRNEMEVPEVVV